MNILSSFSFRIFVFASFALLPFSVFSQDVSDGDLDSKSPYFVVLTDDPSVDQLPLKVTSVSVDVVGSIADVKVRQTYVNSGKNTLEAIYTFPMSTKAAVYAMKMSIGSRSVTAIIEESEKARADYEKAKMEGKHSSLLEQSRPNVFTMNVSNIMTGDTVVVELCYTELLVPENGEYKVVYPTVVGPRYVKADQIATSGSDKFTGSPYTHSGVMPTYDFSFSLTLNAPLPIRSVLCNTHKINVRRVSPSKSAVTLHESESDGGNRDVVVSYSLRGKDIQTGLMLYEGENENFFMMTVQPPSAVKRREIPPREYIFVLDVSGSMHGFPLEISKKLMRSLIDDIDDSDRFNVLLFSGSSQLFSDTSVVAVSENVDKAVGFIDNCRSGGGTEMLEALKRAYAIPRPVGDVSRTVVVVTDGYVNVEKEVFEFVRQNNDNTNLFAFGIGKSVNRYIIEGMAFVGNGEPIVVTNVDEAETQANRFRSYINTPVLSHIKLDIDKFQAYDIEPLTIPDMMAERPILIMGKYKGSPQGSLTVRGITGSGAFSQTYRLHNVLPDSNNAALRYLWARERIKYLEYLVGNNGRGDDSLARMILELGLQYNLMTNYTSFVAVDEKIVNVDGKMVSVKQPLPMPQGVSDYALGGARSKNALLRSDAVRPEMEATSADSESDETAFVVAEVPPEFPGGMDSLVAFLSRHVKYPERATEDSIEGKVFVSFVIEKDGSLSSIKVIHDIGGGCAQEVIRVLGIMPKWKPAMQDGQPVRFQFTLPVYFNLVDDSKKGIRAFLNRLFSF